MTSGGARAEGWRALGIAIGHATDEARGTGLTVVRGIHAPMRGAAAVLGRATATRELDTLSPHHLADRVDAVLLAGGSAFGLDAAAGVMRWMEERGRGFPVGGGAVVPIVPAAAIFDLFPLGEPRARPTPEMAYAACEAASPDDVAEGSVGAGTGTTVGKALGVAHAMKGGVGCWVERADDLFVGAVTVVNALGDVRDGAGRIIAGARRAAARGAEPGESFVDAERALRAGRAGGEFGELAAHHTTLSVVACGVPMERVALARLAQGAGVALARRITPSGTSYDGDIVFALCPRAAEDDPLRPVDPLQVEALAAWALERAVERAVRLARGRDGIPGLADRGG
jgi:L-aminopeptidase/D-esterase-like protein